MEDLAIKNGLVVTPSGVLMGGLTAKNGRITCVGDDASLAQAKTTVDAAGKYILPGLIDTHAHLGLNEYLGPSGAFGPEIRSESAAAAISGITTLVTTSSSSHFNPKLSRLEIQKRDKLVGAQNSFIDFKITHVMVTEGHLNEIPALFKEGCTSFKFHPSFATDWAFIYRGYQTIGSLGRQALACQHAEQAQIINMLTDRARAKGGSDLKAFFDARPPLTEAMDVAMVGLIGLDVGCTTYIVHISAKQTMDVIKFLRQMGSRVYAETCPHYLARTDDEPLGIEAKLMPPIREKSHPERLWQAVAEGTIDTIGQDSGLSDLHRDKRDRGIWDARPSWPGMGAMLPVMMTYGVHKGKISMEQLVKITSENSARAFSIYPKKGVLSPGSDADIVIVDPDLEWKLGVESLKGGMSWTPWEGIPVKGKAVKTFVRGRLVAEEGHLVSEAPRGEFIEPILLY
ncbi:MAG: amidohydrolase family protein [Chloroflexi bacterium]|nr:amidohydrolase family protein [Chloroflexota bacterium]